MRLWEYDEFGEPWLENGKVANPPLIIVNRKSTTRKGKKSMARRTRRRVSRRRSHVRKNAPRRIRRRRVAAPRRRRRRNPYPMAGTVAMLNPRRRRRGRRNSPRRHRRHGYRRNPAIMGIQMPGVKDVLFVAAGFVGTPVIESYLMPALPVSITSTPIGRYAVKIASALGLGFVAKMAVGADAAKMVTVGGGVYVLTQAIREFAPGMIPGLSAYTPSSHASMQAYAGATSRTFNQLGAPNFGAQSTAHSAAFGGSRIVATRFRRFQ